MSQTMKSAVGATIKYYENYGRPLKAINLHPNNWAKFRSEFVKDNPTEDMNIDHFNEVMVKDVVVRKGNQLMPQGVYLEFKTLVYDEEHKKAETARIEKIIDENR